MFNVLFSLDSPVECLQEIKRVLRPGGALSLSTSTASTDIQKLFHAIEVELRSHDQWGVKEQVFVDASERNQEMTPIIVHYTRVNVDDFLTQAGFSIIDGPIVSYVCSVVVYKAIKTG